MKCLALMTVLLLAGCSSVAPEKSNAALTIAWSCSDTDCLVTICTPDDCFNEPVPAAVVRTYINRAHGI